jgi:hypothetical protein
LIFHMVLRNYSLHHQHDNHHNVAVPPKLSGLSWLARVSTKKKKKVNNKPLAWLFFRLFHFMFQHFSIHKCLQCTLLVFMGTFILICDELGK